MGQGVSVEAALLVFRQRCSELNDENLVLRARVNELQAHNSELAEENERLKAAQQLPSAPIPDEYSETPLPG